MITYTRPRDEFVFLAVILDAYWRPVIGSSQCTAARLNSLPKILLDNPMTHFPFQWILSLNCWSQKWGQVQTDLTGLLLTPLGSNFRKYPGFSLLPGAYKAQIFAVSM